MSIFAITFAYPWLLAGLVSLPLLYFLLRLTPPSPRKQPFAPILFLQRLRSKQEESNKSPWWLILLRLLLASCIIAALASPLYQPSPQTFDGEEAILLVVDDRWSSAPNWEQRRVNVENWLQHAQDEGRAVTLAQISQGRDADFSLKLAAEAASVFATVQPQPIASGIIEFVEKLKTRGLEKQFDSFDTWVWFADGLENDGHIFWYFDSVKRAIIAEFCEMLRRAPTECT